MATKAVLNVNGRKMTVDVKDLRCRSVRRRQPPRRAQTDRRGAVPTTRRRPISAELNLIGQRVDDALDESDKFLDRALLEGKQAVRIIHGFGTGRCARRCASICASIRR